MLQELGAQIKDVRIALLDLDLRWAEIRLVTAVC